jgi:hypothetical protein
MELDTVVPVQDRRVLVRKPAPLERLASELSAEREHVVGVLMTERLEQRCVSGDDVVVAEGRRLVRRADCDAASLSPCCS